ncbi:uncharacterized protein VICG_01353 [Vittaforma corneae ATCC 50505]|uniref:Rab GDP dissociation inhibitor n=1 Tax=Vittaforma corneae (strain ATCC 50505) TaxID=993615 RepID=L2GMA5_VITCO|nr:uncharacterized protein VICG_01353 [Vittaforma corneae ATCC 50505]ELA41605.1 hypothetical protein VICG_01353 [Vittaforma corneae ATCC 50505]
MPNKVELSRNQAREANEPIEHYDYVIIGTGLAETALSSILATNPNIKVLHIDTNSTYGNEFSTYNYTQLLNHFQCKTSKCTGSNEVIDILESDSIQVFDSKCTLDNRSFNIDLTPKLLLQDSPMKDFLLNNKIHDIVLFTSIKGSYLYTDKLHSIPTNEMQSLRSSVVGFRQKCRVVKFFWNVRHYYESKAMDSKKTMLEEFQSFGLNEDSIDFIGHAVALNLDDKYLEESPKKTYERIVRYVSSIVSYEDTESPYIYPLYGLSELCQAFARKAALCGTTFMLNAQILEIEDKKLTILDPNGDRHVVKADKIISDPKYWPGSIVQREIIRCIMVLRKGSLESRNIIFLKRNLKRQNDIFCVVLGEQECASPAEYEIGILSTVRESDRSPEEEIEPVLKKFNILRYFVEVRKLYSNVDQENVYFTRNVDESALLDNIYDDIVEICGKLKVAMPTGNAEIDINKD